MLRIMTSRPMVTMMSSVKLNQPMTMALDPTPLSTLPLPKSCAMMLAATDAVCCHSTDTSTKMLAMKMMASATWLTGRLGNGLTSRSDPSESSSSCQPGKVASRRRQTKAKMMAMMLAQGSRVRLDPSACPSHSLVVLEACVGKGERRENAHEVGEDDHVLELTGQPDEVEGVLVHRNLVGQSGRVVTAQPRPAVRVDADAEESHPALEVRPADDVRYGPVDIVVHLGRVRDGRVVLVVQREEEDVGYERG